MQPAAEILDAADVAMLIGERPIGAERDVVAVGAARLERRQGAHRPRGAAGMDRLDRVRGSKLTGEMIEH